MDKRLTFIAELARRSGEYTVVDCGCDHGKVPYYLLAANDGCRVVAIDKSAPSLNKARELLAEFKDRVRFECASGLECLRDERFAVLIISGIGGHNILEILTASKAVFDKLILSPHRDADLVIEWLVSNGYEIRAEHKLQNRGKNYTILEAKKQLL